MEVNNQVIDLKQKQKEIKMLENKIKKSKEDLSQLEIELKKIIKKENANINEYEKELQIMLDQYYFDYFNMQRPLYTKLENIPCVSCMSIYNKKAHPLAKYSKFHLEELGEVMVDFIKYKRGVEAKSKIEIVTTIKRKEDEFCKSRAYYYYKSECPHLFVISKNKSNNPLELNDDNIADISFTDFISSDSEKAIKCINDREILYYSYYNQLIENHPSWCSLFNLYRNADEFEELICNLAYYQKQINETQLPEGELLKAYKKIYKR